tara:strand:+ start:768 stop:992 length:225 start_codon:yes stop_codon:yes gene_type:complete
MPGSYTVITQSGSTIPESVKLKVSVALHTRIWSTAHGMISDIRRYHVAFKVITQIEDVMFDAERICHPASIVYV